MWPSRHSLLYMHKLTQTFSVDLPSGLYCATMVTDCPAFFKAAAACSWVAYLRSTPLTYKPTSIV